MSPAELLQRLQVYQERALSVMALGEALLAAEAPHDLAGLAVVRFRLLRLLSEYQAFKHREIFHPVIGGENDTDARLALLMKEECVAIDHEFRTHVLAWSGVCSSRWDEYRPAALTIRERLLQHLVREQIGVKRLFHWTE